MPWNTNKANPIGTFYNLVAKILTPDNLAFENILHVKVY